MPGISTNPSSASALFLLTGSTKALDRTLTQASSGKDVNKAADNAAYWSIATSMRSTGMSLSSVQDASGLAAATADVAALGMEQATEIVSQIKSKLVLAYSSGVDKDAINGEISQLKEQLGTVTQSASFNGENWLQSSSAKPGVKSLLTSMGNGADGSASVNSIKFDTAETTLVNPDDPQAGLLTKTYSGTTASGSSYSYSLLSGASEIGISKSTTTDQLDGMISAVDSMLSGMTSAGAKLGATSRQIGDNTEFLSKLQDSIDRGVGRMVDANMQETAVKLAAIKVQQQLQIAGLNIVNDQAKSILQLFR